MIKETYVMTAHKSVDPAGFLREQLESASPDLLRDMVKTFAEALMSAEADAVCGAPYGVRSDERTNSRNGYRARDWDTRVGTVELAIPKLRTGSYCCGLAVGASPPRRAGPGQCRGYVVPAGGLDPAGGETCRATGCCAVVQEPGQRDGCAAGCSGGGVS